MSIQLPEQIGQTPESAEQAYLPFAVASDLGLINLDDVRLHTPDEAFTATVSGRLPEQGGVIDFDDRGLGAVDLLAVRKYGRGKYVVLPSRKEAVDETTDRILDEGVLAITWPEEDRIKLFAFATEQRRNWQRRNVGGVAVKPMGIEAIDCDILKTRSSGLIIAQERRFSIAF